jgi:hypothetical protein
VCQIIALRGPRLCGFGIPFRCFWCHTFSHCARSTFSACSCLGHSSLERAVDSYCHVYGDCDAKSPNHAMERTSDRCTLHFCDDFHTSTPIDARSRPPSLILFSLGLWPYRKLLPPVAGRIKGPQF